MSSISEVSFTVPPMKSVDVIRLVYEQFRPMTKICGPLLAATLSFRGEEGSLYLTETQYWLWSGSNSAKELTHPEVDVLATPQELLRNLLLSAGRMLKAAEAHLGRVEQATVDVPSLLGYYLARPAETMTDVFATKSFFTLDTPEEWKRIKKSSER